MTPRVVDDCKVGVGKGATVIDPTIMLAGMYIYKNTWYIYICIVPVYRYYYIYMPICIIHIYAKWRVSILFNIRVHITIVQPTGQLFNEEYIYTCIYVLYLYMYLSSLTRICKIYAYILLFDKVPTKMRVHIFQGWSSSLYVDDWDILLWKKPSVSRVQTWILLKTKCAEVIHRESFRLHTANDTGVLYVFLYIHYIYVCIFSSLLMHMCMCIGLYDMTKMWPMSSWNLSSIERIHQLYSLENK